MSIEAAAQTWTGATSTSWATGTNWSAGARPTGAAPVTINNDAVRVTVADAITFTTAQRLYLGSVVGGSGTLDLVNGSNFSVGRVTIGGPGNGRLNLLNSTLQATLQVEIGMPGAGYVTVDGATASLSSGSYIAAGTSGRGELVISNGGRVVSARGFVGDRVGSEGNLLVTGLGSNWSTSSLFGIAGGSSATGTVVIENGGSVTAGGSVILGGGIGSSGSATVTGAGSAFTGQLFTVGDNGVGELRVLDGGRVATVAGFIGNMAASAGSVTVNGAGSLWEVAGLFGAGGDAGATVVIENGGTVTAGVLVGAGFGVNSNGLITVTGSGSSLTAPTLQLALGGRGELRILDGGLVGATQSNLATDAGSTAVLQLVSGPGGRGTLETSQVTKGDGSASVLFDGGVLRATGSTTDILEGFAPGDIQLLSLGAVIDTNGHDIGISTAMTGAGGLRKEGPGTLVLTGDSSYGGGTSIDAGTLQIGDGGTSGSISGAVVNNGTLTFNRSDAVDFVAEIAGTGSVVQAGTGETILSAVNGYGGGTTISAGTLVGTTASFGTGAIFNDAALVFDQDADGEIDAAVSGSGSVAVVGAGLVRLTGDSANFTGLTNVGAGSLAIDGTLGGSLFVEQAGRLMGAGTVGDTTLAGTVAPGNSIGTLNVAGEITFASTGIYEVETGVAGSSDRIVATGQATLNGAEVRLTAFDNSISYHDGQTFTILQAAAVSGQFSPTVVIDSAFLRPTLTHSATDVNLTLATLITPTPDPDPAPNPGPTPDPTPNPVPDPTPVGPATPDPTPTAPVVELPAVQPLFATVAETRNQFETATALDALGQTEGSDELALYNSILFSDADTARSAFDQLSGEGHASLKSALIDESALVRDAIGGRARSAFGRDELTPIVEGEGPAIDYGNGVTGWGRAFGTWGSIDGDGNAAEVDHDAGGFYVGIDGPATEAIRLGVVTGYTASDIHVASRAFSAEVDSYTAGIYATTELSVFGVTGGVTHTWHKIETERSVQFGGFSDALTADYDSATSQAFGEVGYKLFAADAVFEPFAGLAYVNLDTDGFGESGGAASLTSRGESDDTAYSTLGLRAATDFAFGSTTVRVDGGIAWRHAFETVPEAALALGSGTDFTVAGVPLSEDAALVQLGLSADITENATIGLTYGGQFGDGTTRNDARLDLSVNF